MRTSLSLLPALAAAASAVCDSPISASKSLLLPHAPSALTYINNFGNGTFLFPQSAQSDNTRVLSMPSGPVNETLVLNTSTNSSWLLSWSLTEDTPAPEVPGCTVDSYTHTLAATVSCPGAGATLLRWDSAVCITDDSDRAAAQSWLSSLQNLGAANIIAEYGGNSANSTSCETLGGPEGIVSILPIVPTGTQAMETLPAQTEGGAMGTGVMGAVPTGGMVNGNATNGTVPAWAQPTMVAGSAGLEQTRMSVMGLVAVAVVGMFML
ncbi:hypothetical protein EDC01DRAFT_777049 [Geopyxis carbonaria]|nr:hypothetical protein EDC01DRAFT_777049 [Geopyxis carbonaria]